MCELHFICSFNNKEFAELKNSLSKYLKILFTQEKHKFKEVFKTQSCFGKILGLSNKPCAYISSQYINQNKMTSKDIFKKCIKMYRQTFNFILFIML